MIPTDVFVIESLTYYPLGASVPVLTRPHVVNPTGEAISALQERMMANQTASVNIQMLNGIMGEIITPASIGEVSAVDGSWVSTRRYAFILKVAAIDAVGSTINSYYFGYTDHDGINEATGSINYQMVHSVNSVIETVAISLNTPLGVVRSERLLKVYNVMASQNQSFFSQRPIDVIENIEISQVTNFVDDGSGGITGVNLAALVNPFNMNVISSAAGNCLPSEYLAKTINGGIEKRTSREVFQNSFDVSTDYGVSSHLVEPDLSDNRFMKVMSRNARELGVRENFRFAQLAEFDNTIADRAFLNRNTNTLAYKDDLISCTPETGDHWSGSDPVTVKAYSIIESSVAMAMRYGFTKLYFEAGNLGTINGMGECAVVYQRSMLAVNDEDIDRLLDMFRSRFLTEVFVNETSGGVIPLYIRMYVDLTRTSKVYLEYAGMPGNWYTIPSVASSLFSPVKTSNSDMLDLVTSSFTGLLDEINSPRASVTTFY